MPSPQVASPHSPRTNPRMTRPRASRLRPSASFRMGIAISTEQNPSSTRPSAPASLEFAPVANPWTTCRTVAAANADMRATTASRRTSSRWRSSVTAARSRPVSRNASDGSRCEPNLCWIAYPTTEVVSSSIIRCVTDARNANATSASAANGASVTSGCRAAPVPALTSSLDGQPTSSSSPKPTSSCKRRR